EFNIDNQDRLQAFRMMYLVKKGKINALFESFRELDGEGKRVAGKPLNELKTFATEKFDNATAEIGSENKENKSKITIDKSLPVQSSVRGGIHPITLVIN